MSALNLPLSFHRLPSAGRRPSPYDAPRPQRLAEGLRVVTLREVVGQGFIAAEPPGDWGPKAINCGKGM